MAALEIAWHPEAVAEAAFAHAFLREIDIAMQRVSDAPECWPEHQRGTRRVLLHGFPFLIVYAQHSGRIDVIAVAHAKRRPGYWKARRAQDQ